MRKDERQSESMRTITIEPNYTIHAEGSCLIAFGNTKVICTASVQEGVPNFLKGSGQGWVTAEYSMLPRSTHSRMNRESRSGKLSGRTQEISRLIGRSLRAAVDMAKLGEVSILIDCDVIQADGGTRTAAISGGYVAMAIAVEKLIKAGTVKENPFVGQVGALSVGIVGGEPMVDLCYEEDSSADVDMNIVMLDSGALVEVQGSAEHNPFSRAEMDFMLDLAAEEMQKIFTAQTDAVRRAAVS